VQVLGSQRLDAVESASPAAAVDAFAQSLGKALGARGVRLWTADVSGRVLVFVASSSDERGHDTVGEQVDLRESPWAEVVARQECRSVQEDDCVRVLAPVTTRGDAMGVLEIVLDDTPDDDARSLIAAAAHQLAFVVTAERRHTDLYEWGQRTRPVTLAAEIQRRLLPASPTCEAGQCTVAGWLEPASSVGGDTFDYAMDRDRLYLALTDAMGHDVAAALLATLAVGSLRNGRRAGQSLPDVAAGASRAVADHGPLPSFVTGLLMRVDLATGTAQVVNAGHPPPFLIRDGRVDSVDVPPDLPLGVLADRPYRVHELRLRPGDRLVLATDGMLERGAEAADLPALLLETRPLHPREAMPNLTRAVLDAVDGDLRDDAAVLCLDWLGEQEQRPADAGASVDRASG